MKRLLITLSLLTSVAASAQYYQQSPKFAPSGFGVGSRAGRAVALSADASVMILGAPGGTGAGGAAVICNRSGSNWSQGQTLIGSGAFGGGNQGYSVDISDDGNTAVVGGCNDDANTGAVWVYTRSGGIWSQQGMKLVGSGATGKAYQGQCVAISGDGNTIVFGGPGDNNDMGAVWVFTRSGGAWSQVGTKLVGSGGTGTKQYQGFSVAISTEGTIIEGAAGNGVGAAWVFTKSGGSWTQQAIITTSGGSMGHSVAISADGNTAIIGCATCGVYVGRSLVYKRSGSTWSAGSSALVGTLPVGNSMQGESVALSADGKTAVIGGGGYYNSIGTAGTGAAWVFKDLPGGGWTQQGEKYVGTGAAGNSQQGPGVAVSADGNTFIVGGPGDNSFYGAAWVWSSSIPATTTPPYTYVSSVTTGGSINIYPNPAGEQLTIDFGTAVNEPVSITITDQLGRVMTSVTDNSRGPRFTQSLSALVPGIYVLSVHADMAGQQKIIFAKK